MDDYKQYLAQKLLSEDQLVTYRLLSRALGVHVNIAKEMLYDFHKWQNDKRPGSLHATYIVYGTRSSRPAQHDGDVEMASSQMTGSQMTGSQMSEDLPPIFSDLVSTYTVALVRQEQLEEVLAQYTEVTSIYVYSLAPHPLKDLQLLADTARQVLGFGATDTKAKPSKVYGTIINPNVRRRERRRGKAPAARAPTPKPEPKPVVKQEAKPPAAAAPSKDGSAAASSKSVAAPAPAKKPAPAGPLKRQASSGIGQMFAKAAAKPKKPTSKTSEEPAATGALSDDGEDDAEPMAGVKHEDAGSSAARQARKDRQAELRRMMEESDDEEEEEEEEAVDPMDEEPLPEPEPEELMPEPKVEEPAEVVASTTGGRRRGRRRVTRKKQIMDDKGYLVTIQEQGWESFSEDEAPRPPPPPPAPKARQQPVKSEQPAAKTKKGGAKGAQGNIMSFFSKK
ncbi:hypothetical protein F4802DRAFT_591681 [Xylaria palmicola]|nr:hypothetical protein F4802DRAFT_591681 [Xylaria palmicola]